MSTFVVKTTYKDDDGCGGTTTHVLYAKHYRGSDVVTFYDGDGKCLFSTCSTQRNNIMDAIERLYELDKINIHSKGDEECQVEYVSTMELSMLKI